MIWGVIRGFISSRRARRYKALVDNFDETWAWKDAKLRRIEEENSELISSEIESKKEIERLHRIIGEKEASLREAIKEMQEARKKPRDVTTT